jgi:hypothetical protein
MKNHRFSYVLVGVTAPLLLLAASPANAPTSDVLTLISPNEEIGSHFGGSVAGAGDVNQDGLADVIVGAPGEGPGNSPDHAGRAYIFSSQDGSLLFELASPNEQPYGQFGTSVAGAGDVNRDGFADLIVAADLENPLGRAYVFSGQNGSLLFELELPNQQGSGRFGCDVASAGDVNQDGFADLIVGAELVGDNPSGGRAFVFSGQDGKLIIELVSPHAQLGGSFGFSVGSAGDLNQDGFADVIVGAQREDHGDSPSNAGRAYVFSVQDGSVLLELTDPNEEYYGWFGHDVASAGDINQDGVPDVLVGAPHQGPGTEEIGRAYVFSGQSGSVLFELESPNDEGFDHFGYSVASAGDIDHDRTPDVLVGARWDDPGNSPDSAGRAYLFSGRNGRLLFELMSPNEEVDGWQGHSVSGAGDVNQDGTPDVIVGAPGEDPGGHAYIYLSPFAFRINSGGPAYTDTHGSLFVGDRAYTPGGVGYVGGLERRFNQPIGGTDDDPLYQDVRVAREGDGDGIFSYRFDVASAARYDVTLYLMAPALDGAGNVVMDVQAEEDVVFNDLDVTAEAGGAYQALVKTFAVDVNDGTLDLRFRAVNKAAVVSAIAVAAQTKARGSRVSRQRFGGE